MRFVSTMPFPLDSPSEIEPGVFLLKNLRRSVAWRNSQRAFATAISGKHSKDVIKEWSKMRDAFDEDPTKPNPYVEPKGCQFLQF